MTFRIKPPIWPIVIAVAAVVIRWIYLYDLSGHPGFAVPMVDEKFHWEWALEILHTSFFGEGTWFRAPLYPYVLAFLALITGESILWVKLLQVIICGGTAFFLVRLGQHLFGDAVGIIAGLMYAAYGTLLYYEPMFLLEGLFLFFVVWGMFRLIAYSSADKLTSWLATGAVFGLAAITRPNILLVIPLLLIWVFRVAPRRLGFFRRFSRPVILLAGLLIVIAPVTLRNFLVTGDFTLISSQGGVNLYLGNNPVANGLSMRLPEVELSESLSWRQFQPATLAAAERLSGRKLTEGEASDFWTRRTMQWIKDNPGSFASLLFRKTIYLLSGFENSDNSDIYYERGKSTLYAALLWDGWIDFPFGLLLPLTIVGIWLCRRETTGKLAPVYLFLIAYIPTIILFLVTARHRMPLLPFMMIIAAAGLVRVVERIRKESWRDLGIGLGLALVALVVFNQTYFEEGGSNAFQIHFNAGIKEEHLGNLAAAENEYLTADRHFGQSPALLTNLGRVQYELGKYDEADRSFHRALAIEPTFYRALNNLGLLVEARGLTDSALALYTTARLRFDPQIAAATELGQIHMNLGRLLERAGHFGPAAAHIDSALAAAPEWPRGAYQAAAFYARQSNFVVSDSLFIRGRHLSDPEALDLFNWGLSHMQRKQYDLAIGFLRGSLKKNPSLAQAHYLLSVAFYETAQPADSVRLYLDNALRYDPQYRPAVEFRQFLDQGQGK